MTRRTDQAIDHARRSFLFGRSAVTPPHRPHATGEAAISITSACLAGNGVICQSCRDECPEAAVIFRFRIGAPAVPLIDPDRCTGCGDCIEACPVSAIEARAATSGADHE